MPWSWAWPTPATASSSARRSTPSRESRASLPGWWWRRCWRASSRSSLPAKRIRSAAATSRRAWQNCWRRGWPGPMRMAHCRSTAATATRRNIPFPACFATQESSTSSKGLPRYRRKSSPAGCWRRGETSSRQPDLHKRQGRRGNTMIPEIDIASLFGPPGQAQERTDRAIMAAAEDSGFMVVAGLPASVGASREAREELLRFFSLPLDQKMRLARQKFAPENPNVYRGYFPPQEGQATYKEGIDLGPDLAWDRNLSGGDPLMEATPRPAPAALPGWCEAASSYHAGMERVGAVLLAAIARGLGLRDDHFA